MNNRVDPLSRAILVIVFLCQILTVGGCSSDNPADSKTKSDPMQISLINFSDCLSNSFSASGGAECFEYSLDSSGVLTILHHNAGFNCCFDSIYADIQFSEDTIIFNEHEGLSSPCRCLCLYDVEYRIENVVPGTYTMIFNDSYIATTDSMLSGAIDLETDPEGSICLERSYYPWPEPPDGSMISRSNCLNHSFAAGNSVECFEYSFDDGGILTVFHRNAAFNCCPDSIYADIDFDNQTVTFSEHEGLTMPCECLCLYDIEYRIENLTPGTYRLIFDCPYVRSSDSMLSGTIDLDTDPAGSVCKARGYYPWPLPPSGFLTGISDCRASQSAHIPQTCIDFDYDGYSVLNLTHIDAFYNCCLDSISAAFTFGNDSIIIGETEWLADGGCDCVCPININFYIQNLPPGIYTLVIGSAAVDPAARQSAVLDLSDPINSSYCFEE